MYWKVTKPVWCDFVVRPYYAINLRPSRLLSLHEKKTINFIFVSSVFYLCTLVLQLWFRWSFLKTNFHSFLFSPSVLGLFITVYFIWEAVSWHMCVLQNKFVKSERFSYIKLSDEPPLFSKWNVAWAAWLTSFSGKAPHQVKIEKWKLKYFK